MYFSFWRNALTARNDKFGLFTRCEAFPDIAMPYVMRCERIWLLGYQANVHTSGDLRSHMFLNIKKFN